MSVGAAGLLLWATIKYGVGSDEKPRIDASNGSSQVTTAVDPSRNGEENIGVVTPPPPSANINLGDAEVTIATSQPDAIADPFAPQIATPTVDSPPSLPVVENDNTNDNGDIADVIPGINLPDVTTSVATPASPLALPETGDNASSGNITDVAEPITPTLMFDDPTNIGTEVGVATPGIGQFPSDLTDDENTIPLVDAEEFTWQGIMDGGLNGQSGPPIIPMSPTEGLINEIVGNQQNKLNKQLRDELGDSDLAMDDDDLEDRIVERRSRRVPLYRLPYNIQKERPEFDYKTHQRPEIFAPDKFGKNNHLSELTYKEGLQNEFFYAASMGDLLGLKGLFQSKHIEDIDITDDDGRTALFHAVQNSHPTAVRYLLVNGANPNFVDSIGVTSLHVAAATGRADIINTLLSRGADISIQDQYGNTPFDYAFENGNYIILSMLTGDGVDINRHLQNGSTLLISAIKNNDEEKLKYLLAAGADINQKDANGYTPLMLAGYNGRKRMVDILLELGADVNERDQYNRMAAELADIANHRAEFTAIQSEYMRQQLAMASNADESAISEVVGDESQKFYYNVGADNSLANNEEPQEQLNMNRNVLPILTEPNDEEDIDFIEELK